MNINIKELQLLLNNYTDIIWDYDDTLSNTVKKKGQAYVQLFEDYPEEFKKYIKSDHESNPGISRFKKIPLYHQKSKEYLCNELETDILFKKFSTFCVKILIEEPILKPFENLIRNKKSKYQHHVLTNMPQLEIDQVLFKKNIKYRFKSINGDATDKVSSLKNILNNSNNNSRFLFIGDSAVDLNAANKNNIDFILRATTLNKNIRLNDCIKVIEL